MTDEVRDYASDHGSWPTGDVVRRLRSKTQALGDVAGMQIDDARLVKTSRLRRARLSAMAKPLDVAAGAMVSKMLWPNPQQVQIRWLAVEGG